MARFGGLKCEATPSPNMTCWKACDYVGEWSRFNRSNQPAWNATAISALLRGKKVPNSAPAGRRRYHPDCRDRGGQSRRVGMVWLPLAYTECQAAKWLLAIVAAEGHTSCHTPGTAVQAGGVRHNAFAEI
jgi:hypothetical protein